ncbi:unnamed protein product [Rangifer tarandus platyrhynchus]|uniref:Collagen alpha-1(I) chain-like n=2 Tax=Rangifer tarandus platyrhynchus TaxID=3082113 RepID=A0ABN8YUA9_RANTA|nr:unnamed protein product [Rangifer tarandus platyrhynchus]CAI9702298.1 unnamed protein product [Rangifer tarandus platyrhynchus]
MEAPVPADRVSQRIPLRLEGGQDLTGVSWGVAVLLHPGSGLCPLGPVLPRSYAHCPGQRRKRGQALGRTPNQDLSETKRSDIAGPHGAEEREGACGGQRSGLQASSLAPAPGTRSSQTNGSDPERGHSSRFRCPDSGSWVSGPGAGAGSPPHRLRACPRHSVHWKQSRFIEAHRGWTLPAGLREFIPRLIPFEPKKQADGCFREGQGRAQPAAEESYLLTTTLPSILCGDVSLERLRPTLEPGGLRRSRSLRHIRKKFKTKLMPWGPARRAAQHPPYPARPAPGQPARSREASRARRPADRTTKRGGRAGCSSLPVYSAARVTEILPTPAFFSGSGRSLRASGARTSGRLCSPRPAQRAQHPKARGPGSSRPANSGRSRTTCPRTPPPPPRRGGAQPRGAPGSRRLGGGRRPAPAPGSAGRRSAQRDPGEGADGRDRGHPVPASRPPARAPAPNFAGRRSTRSVFTCRRGFAVSRRAPGVDGGRQDALRARIGPGSPRSPPPSTLPGRAVGLAAAAPPRSAGDPRPRWPVRNAGRGSGRQCRLRLRAVCLPPACSLRQRLPRGPPASPPSPSPSKRDRRRPGGRGGGGVGRPDPERAAPTSADRGHRAGRAGGQTAGPPAAHEARLGLAGRAPTAGRTGNSILEPETAAGAAHAPGNLLSHTGPDAQ